RLDPRKPKIKTVEVNVLKDGACPVQRVVLRHHSNASACDRGCLHNIDSCNPHLSCSRQCPSCADTDRCSLTRAVWAQQSEQLTFAYAEVDAVDGDHPLLTVIDLLQSFNLYDHCGFILGA